MQNHNGGFFNMFQGIVNNANTKLNSEKASKIKKQLIVWGALGAGAGLIVLIVGLIFFIGSNFVTSKIITGMVLFMLGGAIMSIGVAAVGAGVKIVVAGVGANIIDTTEKCPKCNAKMSADNAYCDKCGNAVLKAKLCDCGKQNDVNSAYCKSCGKKL